jgi:peptidyl-prolyl cis-trans isomerase A (cyclophilin A)
MRHLPTTLCALVILALLSGCRSKNELDLIEPGEVRAWQTVETEELRERAEERPRVRLETTMGPVVIELFENAAPVTVENFLQYVEDGFYGGTIFHRVEPGLVIQGGGFTRDMDRKETRDPIVNEAGNGLRNLRGTVGAARTREMDSATSQFYINLVDNGGFNGDGETGGYAVFGRVYEGMEVVDRIALVDTGSAGGLSNVPEDPIVILSATRLQ